MRSIEPLILQYPPNGIADSLYSVFLPYIENELIERARYINIYVEFHSLDNIGTILNKVKAQGAQICDVDISRGGNETAPNPSAVLSVRLEQKQLHTEVLTAIAELDSVYTIDEF